MNEQKIEFTKAQIMQCLHCKYFGSWQPDFLSTERLVCKNQTVLEVYKQEYYNQDNLRDFIMMAEHSAAKSCLRQNRGINIEIAFYQICKLRYSEQRQGLKQKILRLLGMRVW